MTDADLKQLVQSAYDSARSQEDKPGKSGPMHRARSSRFVKALANGFREIHPPPKFAVFSKDCDHHREDFKLNELLFDIQVCETDCVGDKKLCYIKRSVFQIESEFAKDIREALIDFSKLVVGSAESKLFIGPIVSEAKFSEYVEAMASPARACNAVTYMALLPHSAEWPAKDIESSVKLFRFAEGKWVYQ
jgi:hypothetical protein